MNFRGGMNELMRQAARMQRKIEQAKNEVKDKELSASSVGGKVKVTVKNPDGKESPAVDFIVSPKK